MKKGYRILIAFFIILIIIVLGVSIVKIKKTDNKILDESIKVNQVTENNNQTVNNNVIANITKSENTVANTSTSSSSNKSSNSGTSSNSNTSSSSSTTSSSNTSSSSSSNTSSKVMSLNSKATSIANQYSNTTRIEYGESALGRPLEAYLIKGEGQNSKTIFLDFEVHGYEDEYAKDGKVLVDLANNLVEYYAKNPEKLGNYQMIIVPSANPDGVIEGKNNSRVGTVSNPFGRCTAKGVDMNRDFKSGAFKAVESQKLKALMDQYKMAIHIDFHGWEDSVIGDPTIVKVFRSEVGLTADKSNRYGSGQGYLIEFTKNTYGAHSAIVEFKNSKSVSLTKVESALNRVIQEI